MPASSLKRAAVVLDVDPSVLELPGEPTPAKIDYRSAALDVLERVLKNAAMEHAPLFDGSEEHALEEISAALEAELAALLRRP